MKLETFFDNFDLLADAPNGVQKLRELILQLAVRGKLVPQDLTEEQASLLLKKINAEKERLMKEGKIRKSELLPPIESNDLPFKVPMKWVWVRIGNAMNLINGRAFKPVDWSTSGLPIVRIQNLNNLDAPFNYCNFEVDDKFYIDDSDLLISWSGTPGTSFGAFIWERGRALLNQHIFRAELYSDAYHKEFLRLAINARLDEMIAQAHGGVGLQHITKGKLESLSIPLPPLFEQKRIVAKVDQLMTLCDELEVRQQKRRESCVRLNNAAIDQLLTIHESNDFSKHWQRICDNFDLLYSAPENIGKLRQAILQLAIQGKLVLQNQNDEPASVLLEKIKFEKEWLVKEGKIRKDKPLPPIKLDEVPFELPRGWEWVRFCDIAFIASNLVKPESYLDLPHVAPDNIEKQTGKLLQYRTVREDNVRSGNHQFFIGKFFIQKFVLI